jgi:hypothetical protein
VLYAALQPGCCSRLVGLPCSIRTTFFRRWIELGWFFGRIERGCFARRLVGWLECGEFLALVRRLRFFEQSQFRRVSLAQLQRSQLQHGIISIALQRATFPRQ